VEELNGNISGGSSEIAGENVALVRERLEKIEGLRALNTSSDDINWWHKRTRMVIESVVAGNRRFRGALAAFESLQMGLLGRDRPGGQSHFERDLIQAENLLRNLMKDLESEYASATVGNDMGTNNPGQDECDDDTGGGGGATSHSIGLPVIPRDADEALLRLVEAVEKDPGLSSDERHDFRIDVRSLQNEIKKHHPDLKRVLSLIEELSRFEVDLQAIRRIS